MKKDVLIRVKGRQYDGDDSEEMEILTVGTCYEKNKSYYIIYEEILDGFDVSLKNVIKVSKDGSRIQVTKKGAIDTNMVFVPNEKSQFLYHTPYGDICIGTNVEDMASEITETRLFFSVTYSMEVNYTYVAHNVLTIEVTEKK